MLLQTKFLIELFRALPEDAIVHGFADGLVVTNAEGTREVVILNESFDLPADATFSRRSIRLLRSFRGWRLRAII